MTQLKRSSNPPANAARQLIGCLLAGLFGAGVLAAPQNTPAPQNKVNPTGAKVKSFLDRVYAYVTLKKELEAGLPPLSPSDSTSRIEQHQAALAERIRAARRSAKPGDLFGDVAPLLVEIIARDVKKRGRRDTGAALQEVPARSPLAVNTDYPEGAALATVPPLILLNLPPLPDGLEYRFMGRDLILRDQTSNLIVDLIRGGIPLSR
jgi:hypothetical protein